MVEDDVLDFQIMEAVYYGVVEEENDRETNAKQQESLKEFHSKDAFAQLRQRAE